MNRLRSESGRLIVDRAMSCRRMFLRRQIRPNNSAGKMRDFTAKKDSDSVAPERGTECLLPHTEEFRPRSVAAITVLRPCTSSRHRQQNGPFKKFEDLREAQPCCRSVPTVPRSARSLLDPTKSGLTVQSKGFATWASPSGFRPSCLWQNPYVERLIGSLRRRVPGPRDHSESHARAPPACAIFLLLPQKPNASRIGEGPSQSHAVQPVSAGGIVALAEVGGLHHRYQRRRITPD